MESGQTPEPGSGQHYANVDFEEYSAVKPKDHLPDAGSFEHGRTSSQFPQGMFDLRYRTRLSPPFRKSGFEFDRIKVPMKDAYGVKTEMSEKEYLLVGNESLQKNVDQINSQRSEDDIDNSEILIKEQKWLKRRRKMMRIFGEDSLEAELENKDDELLEGGKVDSKKTGKESTSDKTKKNPSKDTVGVKAVTKIKN